MEEKENHALCVDCRRRKRRVFVTAVTKTQKENEKQLVLRHALDVGNLPGLFKRHKKRHIVVEMPVILMGNYSALSSAGHVEVYTAAESSCDEARNGHRKVLIVGGLGGPFGKEGLRVLRCPITATLVRGPVEIWELPGSRNFNPACAVAAWAGVKFLAKTDRKSVFVVEGQSNYTYVVRFQSLGAEGAVTEFPPEYREEMFAPESIVRSVMLQTTYHDLVRWGEGRPSAEVVKAEAKRRLNECLAAKAAGEKRCWAPLGAGIESLISMSMSDEAITKIAEELGAATTA